MNLCQILVVEDEAIVAMDIEDRLTAMGYRLAGIASTGEEGLALVEANRPDLVLMDIRLQGPMDGITAAEVIRSRFHRPVIFLTAYSEDATLERAKLAEPFGYILKPFEDRELKSTIEIALYKHRAEEEIRRLSRLYDVLSQINHAVVRVKSRKKLLDEVCRIVVERGGIDLAWIGWLDEAALRINPIAFFGEPGQSLAEVEYFANGHVDGEGNPGQAIREGKPFVCEGCNRDDCLYLPAKQPVLYGFQSCASFPFQFQGRVCGALNLLVKEPGFFRQREIELLQEVAMDISFALERFEADNRREDVEARTLRQNAILAGINKVFREALNPHTEKELEKICVTVAEEITGTRIDSLEAINNWEAGYGTEESEALEAIAPAINQVLLRKRAEDALLLERNKFRQFLDSLPVGVYIVNDQYEIEYVNPVILSEFGPIEGLRCHEYFHGRDEACPWCKNAEVFAGKTVRWEWFSERTGKTYDLIDTPMYDADGRMAKLEVFFDITARKQAEEEIKRREEKAILQALENASMAKIGRIISSTLNIDEIYEGFSEEVKKIIPFDRLVISMIDTQKGTSRIVHLAGEEIHERKVKHIYPLEGSGSSEMVRTKSTLLIQTENFDEYQDRFPMLLPTFQAGFRSIMNVPLFSKGEIIGGMLLRSRKPHAYTDEEVRLAERIGAQIAGALANAQLYAERVEAENKRAGMEAQLRQAQKMEALGTLAGGIAHDFNNILGIIIGFTEFALMDLSDDAKIVPELQEVLKAANRAKDLVHQILAFSRLTEQEKKPIQVGLIVREAMKMLRASLPSTIDFKLKVASKTVMLGDPTQIHQVLMNLCTNAAHAMREEGGVLEVSLTDVRLGPESIPAHSNLQPGPYLKLTVRDTGHGIDPSIMERIFDPFFTTKEQGIGTGLGLSVVHGIVRSHEGTIEVESLAERGTTFRVFLPAMERPQVSETKNATPLPRGGERILVVDDEPSLANATKRMLERLGYQVEIRTNGMEALEVYRHQLGERPFDLVITDMTMPKLTGADLASELLRLQPTLPILLCTGFSEKINAEKASRLGIRGVLMKPVAVRELAGLVRKLLDERAK